jgi:hypothetical protein
MPSADDPAAAAQDPAGTAQRAETRRAFRRAVNMTRPSCNTGYARRKAARSAGIVTAPTRPWSNRSGRRIVELPQKRQASLTDDDAAHMRTVVGYVRRHCAQGPPHDVETSRWRYSLINGGHDPLQPGARQ